MGDTGTVTTWSWEPSPRPQPAARPTLRLGARHASTAPTPRLLHALDAGSPEPVGTGMRVRVRWADEREGAITDIACFEPADETGDDG